MLKAGAQKVLGQFLRSSLKFQPYFRGGGGRREKFQLFKRGGG